MRDAAGDELDEWWPWRVTPDSCETPWERNRCTVGRDSLHAIRTRSHIPFLCTLRTEIEARYLPDQLGASADTFSGGCGYRARVGRQTTAIQCCHTAHFCRAKMICVSGIATRCRVFSTRNVSGRSLLGTCVVAGVPKMTLQSIEESGLIGVNDAPRTRDLDELGFVDFPRRAAGSRAIGCLRGKRMDALLRARVVDVTEIRRADRRSPGRSLPSVSRRAVASSSSSGSGAPFGMPHGARRL